MRPTVIGAREKMRKAKILDRRIIFVPICGEGDVRMARFEARKWLWEYLKANNLSLLEITQDEEKIRAVASSEKETEIIF